MFTKYSDMAIRVCIWTLVAMCVTLIIITIYLANPPVKLTEVSDNHISMDMEKTLLDSRFIQPVMGACEFVNCTIECRNTSNIYKDIFEALQDDSCKEDFTLNIYRQSFPNFTVANDWVPAKKVITNVSIIYGNFTYIRNEAFNCVDFMKTKFLKIVGINIPTLSNGVLLGLSNLYSLHIVGKVETLHRCFFQPVQSSLARIRLSAELVISGNKNLFGVSFLPNLTALDLSGNLISGPLSRSFFAPVPNLKCITLSNSKISSIEEDAFDDLADTLHLLDLSNNLLTSIDVRTIEPVLALRNINIYLLGNNWFCDCDLKMLMNLYDKYEDRFGDIPYCIDPPNLYGTIFTNVTFSEDCNNNNDGNDLIYTTPIDILKTESALPINTDTSLMINPTTKIHSKEDEKVLISPFRMRCMPVLNLAIDEDSSSSSQMEYFLFAPPCHEFELILLNNNSVQVVIEDADTPINIVWFSAAIEKFVYTIEGITVDYNCEGYTNPYLIVDYLLENSTYTFCLVPSELNSITPFNCLPLHVPIKTTEDNNIWISKDNKQFTVGLVCLIFTCSMLLGGIGAYFGIKAFPDLLEGSKHVLVVKKLDQTCYVSTITEVEYMANQLMQTNSFKKKGSFNKAPLPCTHSTPQMNPLSTLSTQSTPTPPPLPLLNKTVGTSNECLEETDDHYELPCIYSKAHDCSVHCIPNKYALSPIAPPPLPKRNSDVVLYSSNSELLSDKPQPKMSF